MNSIEWLARLVGVDTTSRHSNLPLINLVQDWFANHRVVTRLTFNAQKTKANLVASLPTQEGSLSGGLLLSGHTDVVPVDGQEWLTNPFEMIEKDGLLYGRGTCDMKGFLAVMLASLPHLQKQRFKKPLHFAFSFDEEIGCLGAPLLIKDLQEAGIRPDACIVGEPTMMLPVIAHKGINVFRCRVHGRAVHSSLTPEGCNAIEYSAKLIHYLHSLAERMRVEGPFDTAFDVPFTSLSTNMIHGGIATNTVPALCEFTFEFRNLPQVAPQLIQEMIVAYIQNQLLPSMRDIVAEANIEFENIAAVPAFEANDAYFYKLVTTCLDQQETKNKVAYATEAGLFQQASIPTLLCGPGSIEQAHRENEYIAISQLQACESFLKNIVRLFCVE